MTFKNSPKVIIVKKMISDKSDDISITIDDLVKKYCNGKVDFVKMDIEGMEVEALNGANNLLETGVKFAICTYHNQNDYEVIASLLKKNNYRISHSKGFMMMHYAWNFGKPYIRRGLLFGKKL